MSRSIARQIVALSIPAIITNITTPLLSLADVAIVGHMGSAVFIAAIAAGGGMMNMLYWMFGFLRMGASGITAQAFGVDDRPEMEATLQRSLLLGLFIGIALILLQKPIGNILISVIDADAATSAVALTYFRICIFGAPAVLATLALTGWYIGMQNTRVPMWVAIFIDLSNIAVSLTLVYGFGLKIEGVAIGTIIAQWVGALLALGICISKFRPQIYSAKQLFDTQAIKRLFKINTDILLRTMCLVVVTLWFTRVGARQGSVMLAVNALLMQFFTIFSFMLDGVANAVEALCGQYLGAKEYSLLRRTTRVGTLIGGSVALVFTTAYFVGGEAILGLLSSEMEVVVAAKDYTAWAVAVPLAGFSAFIWDGVMIGTTNTRLMLLSMLSGTVAFFGIYLVAFPTMGNHGLWLAFIIYLLARGLFMLAMSRRIYTPPTR